MTHADLVARLIDVTDRLEHMIKFRHDEAHNGDVYEGGPYSSCGLCAGTREAIDAARDALAALPPPADPPALVALVREWQELDRIDKETMKHSNSMTQISHAYIAASDARKRVLAYPLPAAPPVTDKE